MFFEKLSLPSGKYTLRLAISDGSFINRILFVEHSINFKIVERKNSKFLDYEMRNKKLNGNADSS